MKIKFEVPKSELNPKVGSILVATPNYLANGRGYRDTYYLIIRDAVNARITLLNLNTNCLMTNTFAESPSALLETAKRLWQQFDFNKVISQEEYELIIK